MGHDRNLEGGGGEDLGGEPPWWPADDRREDNDDGDQRSACLAAGLTGPPAPTGPPTDSITSRDSGDDLDHVRTAIQALQIYAEGTHDDIELSKVHKCIVALQSILADHMKSADAAMGVTPTLRHVRRVSRGSGY